MCLSFITGYTANHALVKRGDIFLGSCVILKRLVAQPGEWNKRICLVYECEWRSAPVHQMLMCNCEQKHHPHLADPALHGLSKSFKHEWILCFCTQKWILLISIRLLWLWQCSLSEMARVFCLADSLAETRTEGGFLVKIAISWALSEAPYLNKISVWILYLFSWPTFLFYFLKFLLLDDLFVFIVFTSVISENIKRSISHCCLSVCGYDEYLCF